MVGLFDVPNWNWVVSLRYQLLLMFQIGQFHLGTSWCNHVMSLLLSLLLLLLLLLSLIIIIIIIIIINTIYRRKEF